MGFGLYIPVCKDGIYGRRLEELINHLGLKSPEEPEMNSVDSRLPPLYRKIIECAEEEFPKASDEFCPDKQDGVCEITDRGCRFRDCPKVQEARSSGETSSRSLRNGCRRG